METNSPNLPWPTKGDKLVRSDAIGWDLAFLYPKKFITYAMGYKEAADAILKDARQRQVSADFIAFPAIYLYRHYIELILKAIIIKGQQINNNELRVPHGHDLMPLWNETKFVIRENIHPDEVANIVEGHIQELSQLDNNSQELRYPITCEGDISLQAFDKLDVTNFSNVMNKIGSYLEGTYDVLENYLDSM